MSMEMTFIVTGIEILVISAIISPIIYFLFEHDSQNTDNNKLIDHEHNNNINLEEPSMTTCKNCLHFDACKQWYPSLPDKYHDGCEHFIDRIR